MIKWIVQTNLGRHYSLDLKNACDELGYDFVSHFVIPFDTEVKLPGLKKDEPVAFYGATNWINQLYNSGQRNGIFFNPSSVFTVWNKKYGKYSLNHNSKITTFREFATEDINDNEDFFVRPVSDNKEFAGDVMFFKDIKAWREKMIGDVEYFGDIPIVVGEPFGIRTEWRLFIVDGKVSSGSQYRTHHSLNVDSHVPQDVIDFAEERAKEYSPAPVFVMDIAYSNGLYVLEVGCFNSAGFYSADVKKMVKDVSEWIIG